MATQRLGGRVHQANEADSQHEMKMAPEMTSEERLQSRQVFLVGCSGELFRTNGLKTPTKHVLKPSLRPRSEGQGSPARSFFLNITEPCSFKYTDLKEKLTVHFEIFSVNFQPKKNNKKSTGTWSFLQAS